MIIAISSRVLFDFEEENEIFEKDGKEEYLKIQKERMSIIPPKGSCFNIVEKLLRFDKVEIIIISKNHPVVGLRILQAIAHYKLNIKRAIFTDGGDRVMYLKALNVHLFLSSHRHEVQEAINNMIPAAMLVVHKHIVSNPLQQLRIAFDGDSVLFDDDSEKVFKEKGLLGFENYEMEKADSHMTPGPFYSFFKALIALKRSNKLFNIRIALITSRSISCIRRPLLTLGEDIDEMFLLNGSDKGCIAKAFQADFFFDDTKKHIDAVSPFVASGHVLFGINNHN
jgi:5'-nucleotidase